MRVSGEWRVAVRRQSGWTRPQSVRFAPAQNLRRRLGPIRESGLGLGVGVFGNGLMLGLGAGSSATNIRFVRRAGLGLKPGSIFGFRLGFGVAAILGVGIQVVV